MQSQRGPGQSWSGKDWASPQLQPYLVLMQPLPSEGPGHGCPSMASCLRTDE